MKPYQVLDARKEKMFLPVAFLPKMVDVYSDFMSEYNPESGFLITKTKVRDKKTREEKTVYFLYLGTKHYRLDFFQDRYKDVAFAVKSCDGITQKNTVVIASEGIRVVGIPKNFFFISGEWKSFCEKNISSEFFPDYESFSPPQKESEPVSEGFSDLERIAQMVSVARFFGAPSFSEAFTISRSKLDYYLEQRKTEKEIETEPDPLWNFLLETSEKKKEFESHFLIEWEYAGFEHKDKGDDAYFCEFTLAPPDQTIRENEMRFDAFRKEVGIQKEDAETSVETLREKYLNQFSSHTMIEIPLNRAPDKNGKQPKLFGSVVRLSLPGVTPADQEEPLPETFFEQKENFCVPWKLLVAFKDDSAATLKDVCPSGKIYERVSTDYQNYKSALGVMINKNAECCWKSAEEVIVHKKIAPFEVKMETEYVSKRLSPNQKEAISTALSAPDFCLIQGPPGTGKTTIITEMVRKFVNRGERVLVCSKGNLAVDNVLEKWVEENKMRSDSHLCVRLGQNFKLPFLKEYTPARVTERVQKKAYHKTQEERDLLVQRIEERIRFAEENRVSLENLVSVCALVFDLVQTVFVLLNSLQTVPRYLSYGDSLVPEKIPLVSEAYSVAYHRLFLPCYRALFARKLPEKEEIDAFGRAIAELQKIFSYLAQKEKYGILLRIFGRTWVDLWKQNESAVLSKIEALSKENESNTEWQVSVSPALKFLFLPEAVQNPVPADALREAKALLARLPEFAETERLKLDRIRTVLNDWLLELGSGVSSPLERTVVLDSIPVIGSTCMGVMSDSDFKDVKFDVVIVDEAGQIPIFDLMVPLVKAKKVILIGDHLQLPPMNEDEFVEYLGKQENNQNELKRIANFYNVSLFEKLYRAENLNVAKKMIEMQFRMHPDISEFISQKFYNGQYKAGVTALDRKISVAGFDQPIYFYDTASLPALKRAETYHNPGYSNAVEAETISDILVKILLAVREGKYEGQELVLRDQNTKEIIGYDIGVISGYKKQVKAISELTKQKLEAHMSSEEADLHLSRFLISSVDSFQGRDNQIILFSMTRSNPEGKIGFLKDVRRLNVAMTRAKSLLIMVGDSSTLAACTASCAHDENQKVADVYLDLVAYCKNEKRNYYHPMKGEEADGEK